MHYPSFFNVVQPIVLHDALSDFLGATEEGIIEIGYLDCVKLAGHSCPTVAGAYLMAQIGLKMLYQDRLPQRGEVSVSMTSPQDEGTVGVTAAVISYIVGAGGTGGFKGIQGNFSRNNLLAFGVPAKAEVTLTRLDTGASISLSYNPSAVPAEEKMMPLMVKCLSQTATNEEKALFKTLWQERVKKILLTEALWGQMITHY